METKLMTNNILPQPHLSLIVSKIRTIALAIMLGLGAALTVGANAQAAEEVNISDGYAVHGYDVVAYFSVGQPTEGNDRFTADYQGATYRFASADHRDNFVSDPAKYAPQFGGFCAFGTSVGRKFNGDPNVWRIVDGKLYLNLNKKIQARWLQDSAGYIRGANHNWPLIASLADAQLESNPPEGLTQGVI
jgi:YHS domain-containing protein